MSDTTAILGWVSRIQAGDDAAMGELLEHFQVRLIRLTRKMLRTFPGVVRGNRPMMSFSRQL